MGSGYGFALSAALFVVWIAIGKPLGWSDDWVGGRRTRYVCIASLEAGWLGAAWPPSGCLTGTVAERGRIHAFTAHNPPSPPRKVQWLIIGTTTGVIGTFNAAVLRFTLQQEEQTLDREYDRWEPGFQSFFKAFKLERKGGRWKEGVCLWCGPVPRSLGPAGYQGLADKGAWREHTLAERGRDAGQAAIQRTCAAMHSLKVDAPRAAGPPSLPSLRLAGWLGRSRPCLSSWACQACITHTRSKRRS